MPCCSSDACASPAGSSHRFRRVLWIVLAINAGMFLAEIAAGMLAGSAALQADALDFLADAANYAISLTVLGMTLRWRAGAAWVKGASMGTAFRDGDANMRSVWICSRNDVAANLAVLLAALGVFGTGTGWPDFMVAALMAGLALHGAAQIMRDATREWRSASTMIVPVLRAAKQGTQ